MGTRTRCGIRSSRRFCACTNAPSATSGACHESFATTISKRPSCARVSSIPTATTCISFAAHWGFTPLPTPPRHPQENGKQERSGGYVKTNALKGRRFDSLDAHNAFLRHWNRTIARLRIHGTTRRQVWTHFVEVEQRALQPLAVDAFPFFSAGERTVHTDGHVEVAGAFYPVPLALLGQRVRVRWEAHLVRVFHGVTLVMVHARVAAGVFAPRAGEAEALDASTGLC